MYTGKFDFGDVCENRGVDNILNNYNIYAASNGLVPLRMESYKDLLAYYPYGISAMTSDGAKGGIWLASESYIDSFEKESLQISLDMVLRYYRSCKRKKISFSEEEALKKITWHDAEDCHHKIVQRVKDLGVKATIDHLHKNWWQARRKEWFDDMVAAGWDKYMAYLWVYHEFPKEDL